MQPPSDDRGRQASSSPPAPPAPPLGYNAASLLAALRTVSASELLAAAGRLQEEPCWRSSYLLASAVGGLFLAHRLKSSAAPARAVGDAMLGFLATLMSQWYLCRRKEYDQKLALGAYYKAMAAMRDGALPEGLLPGVLPGSSSSSESARSAGSDSSEWREELKALTTYELPRVTPKESRELK